MRPWRIKMKTWERTAFSWNYRDDRREGLKTNELEPTAYPGCIVLSRISSCLQEDGAGIMHLDFALINTQLKDEVIGSDVRRKLGQLINRISAAKCRTLDEVEEKYERMVCNTNHYLTIKFRFLPWRNNKNFTECTLDLINGVAAELGISRHDIGGGESSRQTLVLHDGHWVDYLQIEELKRDMIRRAIGVSHGEDMF